MSCKRNPPASSNMGCVWERQIRTARKILESLLTSHGASLSDESFTDLLSDVNSLIPLSPINLLTMKSKLVMPPPGVFSTPDIYFHKHWRRV